MEKNLKYYIKKISSLRRDRKNGGAPHKPILLLSVIELISKGSILENKIEITPELVGVFKSYWSALVEDENKHCLMAMPFFHMKSEGFWHLIPFACFESLLNSGNKIRGLNNLKIAIKFAKLDAELFLLLKSEREREILKLLIYEKYFPNRSSNGNSGNYTENINNQIINEPSESYRLKLKQLERELKKDEFEEEKFLRSHLFKQQISSAYNFTCAISNLRIDISENISMLDACHIIPFSHSYDDTITNGFALNPTLHRAFDRGIITIDENYRVVVSNCFRESGKSQHSIVQYVETEITLPINKSYLPNMENFNWHRNNIFIG